MPPVVTPHAVRPRDRAVDYALVGALTLVALLSVVGVPLASARLVDGVARFKLLAWTGMLAAVLAIPAARLRVVEWLAPMARRAAPPAQPFLVVALVVLVALVQVLAFDGMPQVSDAFSELYQARILAAGHLWLPVPERPDALWIPHVVSHAGRWYAAYPIGNPALLAIGVSTGVSWLPAALVALGLATGTRALARECAGEGATALALVLLLASPMVVLETAAGLSNASAAAMSAWALALSLRARRGAAGEVAPRRDIAAAAGPRPTRRPTGMPAAFGAGLLLGLTATVRPLDGAILAAIAVPLAALSRRGRSRRVPLQVLGLAVGLLPLLVANALTTGSVFRLPGGAPAWVAAGSVLGSVRALAVELGASQLTLLSWPVPVLLVLAVLVTFGRPLPASSRVLLAYVLLQVGVHALLARPGYYFGPRWLVPAIPALLVLVAVELAGLGSAGRRPASSGAASGSASERIVGFTRQLLFIQLVAAAILLAWPALAQVGRSDVAAAAAVRDAVVTLGRPRAVLLVNDGWSSRLFSEMARAGVSPGAAARFYATADACRLERVIRRAQEEGRYGIAAERAIEDMLVGATPGTFANRPPRARRSAQWLRLPAGPLPPECAEELAYDAQRPRVPFAPLLWLNDVEDRGVVFWRDPGPARVAWLLLDAERPVYRVRLERRPAGGVAVGFERLLSPGPLRLR